MKNTLCLILAICVLILPNSCTTSKMISFNEVDNFDKKNFLILATPSTIYELHFYKITDEYLEGYLNKLQTDLINVVTVKLSKNLTIKNNLPADIRINRDEIVGITFKEFNLGKTIALAVPLSIVLGLVIWISTTDIPSISVSKTR